MRKDLKIVKIFIHSLQLDKIMDEVYEEPATTATGNATLVDGIHGEDLQEPLSTALDGESTGNDVSAPATAYQTLPPPTVMNPGLLTTQTQSMGLLPSPQMPGFFGGMNFAMGSSLQPETPFFLNQQQNSVGVMNPFTAPYVPTAQTFPMASWPGTSPIFPITPMPSMPYASPTPPGTLWASTISANPIVFEDQNKGKGPDRSTDWALAASVPGISVTMPPAYMGPGFASTPAPDAFHGSPSLSVTTSPQDQVRHYSPADPPNLFDVDTLFNPDGWNPQSPEPPIAERGMIMDEIEPPSRNQVGSIVPQNVDQEPPAASSAKRKRSSADNSRPRKQTKKAKNAKANSPSSGDGRDGET
ncbi:hypothetical protein QBC44DRAFT_316991 [Cladorrhinum sp. PSN332]|nr:hypothetical protein QBC44DRAFT_316991 [Cladorrhinum sp. PSN332]